MIKNMKLGKKLMVAFLAVGLIPFAVIGSIALYNSSQALSRQSFNQLEAVRGIKKAQIERFLVERQGDMNVLLDMVATLKQEAFQKLEAVQQIKRAQIEKFFADRFGDVILLSQNESVAMSLQDFQLAYEFADKKVDSDAWKTLDERYGPWMAQFQSQYGYHDLLLIAKDGAVVYSTAKNSALGQNVLTGPLKDSPLGHCFGKAMHRVSVADFEPYAPADGAFAAFIGGPIKRDDQIIGVVAMQMPTDPVNEIVQRRDGMGKSGETYLVGRLMGKTSFRSDMKTMGDGKFVIGHEISTSYLEKALAGQSASEVVTDSAGKMVMVSYNPLEISGLLWVMVSKIDLEEAIAPKITGEDKDFYAKYIEKYGYTDLYLIHPGGRVFYSVAHGPDYGTNMVNGEYAESGLGKLVRQIVETRAYAVADFSPYAPREGAPASFTASPVMSGEKVELVVALQLSLDSINAIMQQREGMGATGETYLVGPDKLMRSDSFLDKTNRSVKASFANPSKGQVDTGASKAALAGRTGSGLITDYNGSPVLSAYAPVKFGDVTWALIAAIDESEAFAAVKTIQWITAVVAIIGLAGIILVALLMTRAITRPVGRAVKLANAIKEGDLSHRLNMESRDEIGLMAQALDNMADGLDDKARLAEQIASGDLTAEVVLASDKDVLGQALQTMVGSLNQVLGEVNTAAMQVAAGTGEVSDASQSLSQGATEQAASLEEISSSVTELASQTKANAENAHQASQLAAGAREQAERGNNQMQEMIASMQEINVSSREIAKIIKAIDDIAFQTNLLALNAAVEAARAGKHGKGFAVVAQEVRNLASRSAKAAQETSALIEGAVKSVESGMEIVNRTASALGEIVDGATKVADLVGEIAAASNEQAEGISQINQGLSQVDQVTQQNTASAEETASASEELSGQALQLRELVSRFTLNVEHRTGHYDTDTRRPPAHTPAPAGEIGMDQDKGTWGRPASHRRPQNLIALDEDNQEV
ncbi:MAG: HAMP domain-containing protein [Proteobacteria bacterium]|nr:HAMP domain-containing protein [Pseudomonadota bacterium]